MALFAYQGTNVRGETFSGSLRANSSVEARQKLRQKHIKVSSLIEQPETLANKEVQLFNKVSLKLLVAYLRQFSTLIASGITIVDACRMLEEQQKNKISREFLVKFGMILTAADRFQKPIKPTPMLFQFC
ncbi:hypothetical protein ACFC90_02830 [Enterococcus casseliflavus]|uniref:hypothetical protein n=1 Tax=Enterococcus casseliflavus TaxID=37734 RepID=UPI0039A43FBA